MHKGNRKQRLLCYGTEAGLRQAGGVSVLTVEALFLGGIESATETTPYRTDTCTPCYKEPANVDYGDFLFNHENNRGCPRDMRADEEDGANMLVLLRNRFPKLRLIA
jgi:hypothetical protein